MMDFEDIKADKEIVIIQCDRDDWTNPRSTNQTGDITQMTQIAT
jgi:hypothetical protein